MTSRSSDTFKAALALMSAVLVVSVSVRPAHGERAQAGSGPPSVGERAVDDAPAGNEPPGAAAKPKLQLEDEGPDARNSNPRLLSRSRAEPSEEIDERPFWKSWVFWAVTGALVVGAVGMVIYTSSGTNSALSPCPPNVQVSLGCFGAGR